MVREHSVVCQTDGFSFRRVPSKGGEFNVCGAIKALQCSISGPAEDTGGWICQNKVNSHGDTGLQPRHA